MESSERRSLQDRLRVEKSIGTPEQKPIEVLEGVIRPKAAWKEFMISCATAPPRCTLSPRPRPRMRFW